MGQKWFDHKQNTTSINPDAAHLLIPFWSAPVAG